MTKFLVSALAVISMTLASPVSGADTSIGLNIGTLGAGVELAHAFTENLGVRIGASGLKYDTTDTYESVDYDAKLKLATGRLLIDWFPFANHFRISAGAMYNGNELTLDGKPSGSGTYTINGNTYPASQVGSLNGKVDFRKTAPYVGLGYGRPIGKGFTVIADAGVLIQGSPRSSLNATCGASTPAPTCATIQNDVAAERARLDDDVRKYRTYPVLSIGLALRF
jgi:hypothetical protein